MDHHRRRLNRLMRDEHMHMLRFHRHQGHQGLTGSAAVQHVFHFLHGPGDVLRAATACRRWRTLACSNSVWRAKADREGMLEKACVFKVAAPKVARGGAPTRYRGHIGEVNAAAFSALIFGRSRGPVTLNSYTDGGGGGRMYGVALAVAPPAITQNSLGEEGAAEEDEAVGVWLAFYAKVFVLRAPDPSRGGGGGRGQEKAKWPLIFYPSRGL